MAAQQSLFAAPKKAAKKLRARIKRARVAVRGHTRRFPKKRKR